MEMTKVENSERPLVTVVLPAFNEEAILEENVGILLDYFYSLQDKFSWEVIVEVSLLEAGEFQGVGGGIDNGDVVVVHIPVRFGLDQTGQ